MNLLGGVDQEKKKSECSRCESSELQRKRRYFLEECVESFGVCISATAGAASAAQMFDCLKSFIALEPLDYRTKCISQPANVVMQRYVFRPCAGIRRNGSDVGIAGFRPHTGLNAQNAPSAMGRVQPGSLPAQVDRA